MSLDNASIKSGASWGPTGGTDLAFSKDGRSVANGISLIVVADQDLVMRRNLRLVATPPANAAKVGDFPRLGRQTLTYGVPFKDTTGRVVVQYQQIGMAWHPEMDRTLRLKHRRDMAAFLADSDFDAFWDEFVLV